MLTQCDYRLKDISEVIWLEYNKGEGPSLKRLLPEGIPHSAFFGNLSSFNQYDPAGVVRPYHPGTSVEYHSSLLPRAENNDKISSRESYFQTYKNKKGTTGTLHS